MKRYIGSHYANDRWSLYEFSRRSNLPYGYFDRWEKLGHMVAGVICFAIATILLVLAATGMFS